MNPVSLLGHCMELLSQIERSRSTPADTLTREYVRSRKYLGAKERRAISEIVFATLRTKNTAEILTRRYLDTVCLPQPTSALASLMGSVAAVAPAWTSFEPTQVLDAAAGEQTEPARALTALYNRTTGSDLPTNWATELRTLLGQLDWRDGSITQVSLAACLPEWMVESLHAGGMESKDIVALGRAFMHAAPLVLRSAHNDQSREALLAELTHDGIVAHPATLSPSGLVIEQRTYLLDHPLYRNGAIEVQDEGSQLVAFALAPEEHWRILDACAGAGGKTLHLAQLQRDRGLIVATDGDPKRLRLLARRLGRHQFRSIHITHHGTHSARLLREESYDAVLLDVPCSGTGTLRRAPEIKWRLSRRQLDRIVAKQRQILEENYRYVRPGGVLLYVTCSILPEENHEVVADFLKHHPEFVPDPIAHAFARYHIPLSLLPDQWQLQLMPHLHGTDGFYIARLRRR